MDELSIWRPPTRRESCQCTECHDCPDNQQMWEVSSTWDMFYVFWWWPRRILCAIIGHKPEKYAANICSRCWCRKETVKLA